MLTITQIMRIKGGKMFHISPQCYPNVFDAVKYHYAFTHIPQERTPIAFEIGINQVYLDRLEAFLKDEVDLPGFYAFVEGRTGSFSQKVVYPMAYKTLCFILETIKGENRYEHGPHIKINVTFPANTLQCSYDSNSSFSTGDRGKSRVQPAQTKFE